MKVLTTSMTGFGRGESRLGDYSYHAEIKSLNHRFFDLQCKLPGAHAELEFELRTKLRDQLVRGKVELFVVRSPLRSATKSAQLAFNHELAERLFTIYEQFSAKKFKGDSQTKALFVREVLARSEVLALESKGVDGSREHAAILSAVQKATEQLLRMREREGVALVADVQKRLSIIRGAAKRFAKHAAQAPKLLEHQLKAKLQARAVQLKGGTPQSALQRETELSQALPELIERTDITEECVRLHAHLEAFSKALVRAGEGRKLDFLTQELGRELNTIASKSQRSEINGVVVDCKVELEKIREQIQNFV